MSAPIFARALNTSHFCSSVSPSISSSGLIHAAIPPISAAGLSSVSKADATSAVITTGFPFASSLTSTGVAAGKSLNSSPAADISAAEIGSPSAASINNSVNSVFSSLVRFPSFKNSSIVFLISSDITVSLSYELSVF